MNFPDTNKQVYLSTCSQHPYYRTGAAKISKATNILAELYKFDDAIRAVAPLEADAVAVCKDIKIFSQILTFSFNSRCLLTFSLINVIVKLNDVILMYIMLY